MANGTAAGPRSGLWVFSAVRDLILLVATLLDGQLVPAAPGLLAVLLGVTLVVAAPYLRAGTTARCQRG